MTCSPFQLDVDVASSATWSGSLPTHVGWDTANVRPGAPLTVTRMVPLASGTMKVSWKISAVSTWTDGRCLQHEVPVGNASCSPLTVGTNYQCTADSPAVYP
jgi:hypothetical protein